MVVSGAKIQVLVMSQWARDADPFSFKVDGKSVTAGDTLQLLGVTIDRLLHFGPHCKRLWEKVHPRISHLRQLSGCNWGLHEQHLRTVATGYVRGAMEQAAAAWLHATPPFHVELLERKMRASARIITGCTRPTPSRGKTPPVAARRRVLATRLLVKVHALPPEDPL